MFTLPKGLFEEVVEEVKGFAAAGAELPNIPLEEEGNDEDGAAELPKPPKGLFKG